MSECPSRFKLVELRTGDIRPDELKTVELHLQSCQSCRKELETIESTASLYEADKPVRFNALKAAVLSDKPSVGEAPAGDNPLRRRMLMVGSIAAAIIFSLASVFYLARNSAPETGTATSVRIKGRMTMSVVAQRNGRQFKVNDGDKLHPDDAVRFSIDAATSGYLTVFSVNEGGDLSSFYPDESPERSQRPLRFGKKGHFELPDSIILDDSSGWEYFVCVFSPLVFDPATLRHQMADDVIATGGNASKIETGNESISVDILRVFKTKRTSR